MALSIVDILSSSPLQSTTQQVYFIIALCPLLIYLVVKRLYPGSSIFPTRSSQHESSAANKVVVITGADTGFGALASTSLAELGYCVFAGCLDAKKAAETEKFIEMKNCYQNMFHLVQMNVTSDEEVNAAMGTVSEWLKNNPNYHLHGILNNAGITYPMVPLELCSLESFANVVNINVYGALRVLKTFVPLMRSVNNRNNVDGNIINQPGGRVVVMASLAGEFACPMMSAYCASKWALIAISDTLRYELHRFGISVSIILPDLYRTQLVTNKSALYGSLDRELAHMEPDILKTYGGDVCVGRMRRFIELMEAYSNPNLSPVIDSIIQAISEKHPQQRYYPISWKSRIVTALSRLFPSLLDNMVNVVDHIF